MKVLNGLTAMSMTAMLLVASGCGEKKPGSGAEPAGKSLQRVESDRVVDLGRLIPKGLLKCDPATREPFTGLAVEYWPNGKKKVEVDYLDGKPHGREIRWYENGRKKSEIECREGVAHGKAVSWYGNGRKESEAQWDDGKRQGRSAWWYENGQMGEELEYRDGKVVRRQAWDNYGNPKL